MARRKRNPYMKIVWPIVLAGVVVTAVVAFARWGLSKVGIVF